MPEHYCAMADFACAAIFLHIAISLHIFRQRAYVIHDAVIYSKRPLLRLRPLPSNNELSAVKAHCLANYIRRSNESATQLSCPLAAVDRIAT